MQRFTPHRDAWPDKSMPAKAYTVTIEEHVSEEFSVCADSLSEAEDVAKLKYGRGELIVDPAPPTCRMIMAVDDATGAETEWREF